jgi:hypothetical protein
MPIPLRRTLIQTLEPITINFAQLQQNLEQATDLQNQSLVTLDEILDELHQTVDALPDMQDSLETRVRHDLRNQLMSFVGFAHILQHKRTGNLDNCSLALLQEMLRGIEQMNKALQYSKALTPSPA